MLPLIAGLSGWCGYQAASDHSKAVVTNSVPSLTVVGEASPKAKPVVKKSSGLELVLQTLTAPREDNEAQLRCWQAIQGFTLAQVTEALSHIGDLNEVDSRMEVEQMLFFRWGQLDPQAAVESARNLPDQAVRRTSAFVGAFTAWAKADPEAAAKWSAADPEISKNGGLAWRIAPVLLMDEPAIALKRASSMGAGMVREVVTALAQSEGADPDRRKTFLQLLSEAGTSAEIDAGRDAVLKRWAAVNPLEAMDEAGRMNRDGSANARQIVLQQWSRSDPGAAFQWATDHEESVPLGNRMEAYERWLSKAPAAAGLWLDGGAGNPDFYAAITPRLLANVISGEGRPKWTGPPGGAESIKTLQAHFTKWKSIQPEEANQWLGTVGPDVRQKLEGDAR